jgi:HSP20 family protein
LKEQLILSNNELQLERKDIMQDKREAAIQEQVTEHQHDSWEESLFDGCLLAPAVDLYEDDDNYYLRATLHGVPKENIKLKIEDNTLILMAKQYDEDDKRWLIRESACGNYYRKIRLSDSVKIDEIQADYELGRIYVTMPKHENVKPKDIEIK